MTSEDLPPTGKPRVDHVMRPRLPWRTVDYTECGLPAEGHPVIDQDGLAARVKQFGKQRAAMFTCMTCWSNVNRWASATWQTDPVKVLGREFYGGRQPQDVRFADELRAIAALVEAHRDEFDGFLSGLADTTSLVERRRARESQIRFGG